MTIVDYNTMGHTNLQLKLRLAAETYVTILQKHVSDEDNDPYLCYVGRCVPTQVESDGRSDGG